MINDNYCLCIFKKSKLKEWVPFDEANQIIKSSLNNTLQLAFTCNQFFVG